MRYIILLCLFLGLMPMQSVDAQKNVDTQKNKSANPPALDPIYFSSLEWRNIGPHRGGRSAAVCGVRNKPNLYYMGATGGGVWKTKDGGSNWQNISDHFFGGSIGAIAVSESDPNVIYVGGGENTLRGNVSFGYGMFKSTDAGKTWVNIGLTKSRQIAQINIHPTNPDILYVAVIGNIFAADKERGVYRSEDAGKTWQQILYVNEYTGAADIILDPTNPRIIYATTWKVRRSPHSLESGGEGSGIWKSKDGGNTWECLLQDKGQANKNKQSTDKEKEQSGNLLKNMDKQVNSDNKNDKLLHNNLSLIASKPKNGLPEPPIGISCIAISPTNPDRIWAMIEAKEGGLYRSDDGGNNWKRVNDDRNLRQRAWYFSRIVADPIDPDVVYVLNVQLHKSKDGGKSFTIINTPHPDHHALWIAPDDSKRMIVGNDGGAQISFDGGMNWSTCYNQPTGQFYRVSTDNSYPYRILTAQQDNSAIRISHRSNGFVNQKDWEDTAGGESGHIVADPTNPDIVYGGSYDGYFVRYDHATDQVSAINVYPDNPMGHGAEAFKYRFQWNFPIFFSPHNPKKLYAASNHLHVTYDEGHSWDIISPDLTRNDSTRLLPSGGDITKDNTSVEYYCTIFAAAESPRVKDVIWAGSDDGLIHLTKDGGKTWQNVTPKNLPQWTMINCIEPDPHHDGGVYVAATSYKLGDFTPYLYRSKDYGKTWVKVTNGIDPAHFTRAIRCDPTRAGLLYCGTESGMYISIDDGNNWQPFQLNLPVVPITDIAVKENNLIVSTQGRGIWVLDDLTVVQQIDAVVAAKKHYLYQPDKTYYGDYMRIYYHLAPKTDTTQLITMSFWTEKDSLVRVFANKPDKLKKEYLNKNTKDDAKVIATDKKSSDVINQMQVSQMKPTEIGKLSVEDSTAAFVWNGNYPDAKRYDGMILWWGRIGGAKIIPGNYKVQMTVAKDTMTRYFTVLKDPRSESPDSDYVAKLTFLRSVTDKTSQAHETIGQLRDLKKQLQTFKEKIANDTIYLPIVKLIKQIDSTATVIEEALHQPKNKSGQDPINFPIRLNNKLAHLNSLASMGNERPTRAMIMVRDDLVLAIDKQIAAFNELKNEQLPKLNRLIHEQTIDAIWLKENK